MALWIRARSTPQRYWRAVSLKARLHHRFTIRDVPKQGWTGIQSTSDAETALAFWEEGHWVQGFEVATEIGRPTMHFNSDPKARGWR